MALQIKRKKTKGPPKKRRVCIDEDPLRRNYWVIEEEELYLS